MFFEVAQNSVNHGDGFLLVSRGWVDLGFFSFFFSHRNFRVYLWVVIVIINNEGPGINTSA